jgi:quercetin dioxygenase-like cupin family protein
MAAPNSLEETRQKLLAQPQRLSGLVEYQEGAIVSRMLLRSGSGNVTLFAFATGQSLAEHTTPYDALVYVLDGEAEITISGRPIRAKAGEVLIMPANEPHAVAAPVPFKMLLTMIRS